MSARANRRHFMTGRLVAVSGILFIFCALYARVLPAQDSIPVYSVYQVELTTSSSYGNKYRDVSVMATFDGPDSESRISIPGFWDGDGTWIIRMAPTRAGTWTLTNVTSNDPELNGQKQGLVFTARSATRAEIANNSVLRHGFIRISEQYPQRFEYSDGTSFFLMGDTQWERACITTDGLELGAGGGFNIYQRRRSRSGFNAASMAWIGSKGSNETPAWPNEGGYPFDGDHVSELLQPGFFRSLDKRIDYMTRTGIRPMLVIGSADTGLTSNTEWINRYTRYLVARYAAYDVIWFGLKEYQEYPNPIAAIDAYGNAVEETDPYQHPTSTHSDSGSNGTRDLDDKAWLDFHALQFRTVSASLYALGKPVVISEAWYEGPGATVWGPFEPEELLGPEGIWVATMDGGYSAGYEYLATSRGNREEILNNLNTISVRYHTNLRNFFVRHTDYRRLEPHDELVIAGTAEAMARDNGAITGEEYVLYLVDGGPVTLNTSHAASTLLSVWYNPRTGETSNRTSLPAGTTQNFNAPTSGEAWVLHVFRSRMPENR